MIITRTLGKFLRGTVTPFQIWAACLLGSMLGFMPGFAQAPGLILVLLLTLAILNANLGLAGLVGLGAKLLSLLLTPVSFSVGRFLLDGPTEGLARTAINAPVLALFGFDYYVTTGGLVLGLVTGVISGWGISSLITTYRRKMGAMEEGSEKFKRFTGKKWVKILTFLLVGGNKGKKTYNEILAKKVGNPIRMLGVVLAVLLVALLFLAQMFLAGPIVTMALQDGLEKANGATVDVGEAELNLKENRLIVSDLAMADPNQLDTDLFRAARLEADVSGADLLRKRLRLDRVEITDGSQGEKRLAPGRLVGKPPEPQPAPEVSGDEKTLEDYIKEAKLWKERLAKGREWLEKISGPSTEQTAGEAEESLRERLEREIREKGYRRVRATHLVAGAPTLVIGELVANKVRVSALDGEQCDVTCRNLSTHPGLLGEPPEVDVRTDSKRFGLQLLGGGLGSGAGTNLIDFFYNGLPVDQIADELKVAGQQPLSGGTMDVAAKGDWRRMGALVVDLPLQVTLHNTTVTVPGGQATQVENLPLAIGVTGPLDNPKIKLDDAGMTKALANAGVSVLKQKAGEEISKQLGDKVPGEAKGLLNSFLGGKEKK